MFIHRFRRLRKSIRKPRALLSRKRNSCFPDSRSFPDSLGRLAQAPYNVRVYSCPFVVKSRSGGFRHLFIRAIRGRLLLIHSRVHSCAFVRIRG